MDTDKLWQATDKKRKSFDKWSIMVCNRMLVRQQEGFFEQIKGIEEVGMLQSIANQYIVSEKPAKEAYRDIYTKVGVYFARDVYKHFVGRKDIFDDFSLSWLAFMESFAETQAGERITLVTGTTKEALVKATQKAIAIGAQEGYGVAKIARLIRDELKVVNHYRSMRIARTEVVSASNAGGLMGAKSTGLDMRKVWISTMDGKARTDHEAADGQMKGIQENFSVGGEPMQYPGDFTQGASAANVVNCRCAMGYEVVD